MNAICCIAVCDKRKCANKCKKAMHIYICINMRISKSHVAEILIIVLRLSKQNVSNGTKCAGMSQVSKCLATMIALKCTCVNNLRFFHRDTAVR